MKIADYINKLLAMENPIANLQKSHSRDFVYLEMAYREVSDRIELMMFEDMVSPEFALEKCLSNEFGQEEIIHDKFIRVREQISTLLIDNNSIGKGL